MVFHPPAGHLAAAQRPAVHGHAAPAVRCRAGFHLAAGEVLGAAAVGKGQLLAVRAQVAKGREQVVLRHKAAFLHAAHEHPRPQHMESRLRKGHRQQHTAAVHHSRALRQRREILPGKLLPCGKALRRGGLPCPGIPGAAARALHGVPAGAAVCAAGAAGNAVVALAASIYLLSGKEALLRAARACLHAALPPRAAGSVLEICRLANKIFSGYIGGQLVDALLVGGETFALMSIFGLEYAPLLAVLVGVTNIVPVLGPFLGAVPGLIILLLELPWKAAEFAIIIFVVQQVDGNFIAPRILGGATGLPGLGVLLAIVVGGAWFGIPGMVLGVPTLAVLAALLKQAVGAGLTARGLDENGEPRRNLPGGPQEN